MVHQGFASPFAWFACGSPAPFRSSHAVRLPPPMVHLPCPVVTHFVVLGAVWEHPFGNVCLGKSVWKKKSTKENKKKSLWFFQERPFGNVSLGTSVWEGPRAFSRNVRLGTSVWERPFGNVRLGRSSWFSGNVRLATSVWENPCGHNVPCT